MVNIDKKLERIYAWYEGEIIDRVPINFGYCTDIKNKIEFVEKQHKNLTDRWFDAEYQVEIFKNSMIQDEILGEGLPVFMPNLGPNVFASFYGGEIEFMPTTSWNTHILNDKYRELKFDYQNIYLKKIDEITDYALSVCKDEFFVGYTDLHPGLDCVASFRGSENLCMDLFEQDVQVKELSMQTIKDFKGLFNYFNDKLIKNGQLSSSWMGIPSKTSMHIPSCDFSFMISPSQFEEFGMPLLKEEVKIADHNIFHMDGPGVANHLEMIASIKEIQAIQWVQGAGDKPIMQWVPLIKKIQALGKSVVVYLETSEIEEFMNVVNPKGIYLMCEEKDIEIQKSIIKRLEKWK